MNEILRTPRLILREFEETDFESLFSLDTDADVMKYINFGVPRSDEEIKDNLQKYIDYYSICPGLGYFAAVTYANEFLGLTALKHLDYTDEIEIGYRFLKKYWGKGYASEASGALMNYGFNKKNLERIVAVTMHENSASKRIMEKLGMHYEKDAVHYEKQVAYYSISRTEYKYLSRKNLSIISGS
jgi:ribosomal-protein-alanine N-acetyltransferase